MNCLLWQTSLLAVPSYLYYLISYHPLINTYPILSVLNLFLAYISSDLLLCAVSSPWPASPCPSGPTRILMHHVPCCTTSCPVQSPACRVVHAHAYHCLTGPTLKTTFGYVVDLPATSIVQSYCYHYHIKFSPIIYAAFWKHDCSAVLMPDINIISLISLLWVIRWKFYWSRIK